MVRDRWRAWLVSGLLGVLGLLVACGPAPAAPPPAAGAAGAATQNAPAAPTAGSVPAAVAPNRPALATTPVVDLKVGVVPLAQWAPFFIAQDRGYFNEVGLNTELVVSTNAAEMWPALAQGQIHAAACSTSVACYNLFSRGADLKIVADLSSAGKLERFRGGSGIVVRKDLWDSGAIRTARDLVGRSVYIVPSLGTGQHGLTLRWLQREGVDHRAIDWQTMGAYPDLQAALQNGAIETGVQGEPLISAGVANGIYEVLASDAAMDPNQQILYLSYWSGIDRLGPQAGERLMVAYLRAVRDYINAFEYGIDQDAILAILTRETALKDPAIYSRIKLSWNDPNGIIARPAVEGYAELYREAGLLASPPDLSQAFDDKYSRFAMQYLGEYQPPR